MKSSLEIKDVKLFMKWCAEGPTTYSRRLDIVTKQKKRVEAEIQQLHKALDMLNYKCWHYAQATKDGNESKAKALTPTGLPDDVRKACDNSRDPFPSGK